MDHLEALQVASPASERARRRQRMRRRPRARARARAGPVLQARREEDGGSALVGARGEAHGDDARGEVVALLGVGHRGVGLEVKHLEIEWNPFV